jgi:hypothetical protein
VVQVRTALPADLPVLRRLFRRSSLSNEGDRELMIAHPELVGPSDEAVAEGRSAGGAARCPGLRSVPPRRA